MSHALDQFERQSRRRAVAGIPAPEYELPTVVYFGDGAAVQALQVAMATLEAWDTLRPGVPVTIELRKAYNKTAA